MRGSAWVTTLLGWISLVGCDPAPQEPTFDDEPLVIPDTDFCRGVQAWPEELAEHEQALLQRINEHRVRGAECDDIGRFAPSEPLRQSSRGTCAARVHATDMATADFVAHTGSDESSPWDRLRAAGSSFAVADEVIAGGELTPAQVVDELWMPRPGSCAALMAPEYLHLGLGWAAGSDESTHLDYVVVMPERSRAVLHGAP